MIDTSLPSSNRQSLLQRYATILASHQAEDDAHLVVDQRTKLQQLDLLMRTIVEQSFDGIIAVDEHGIVQTANDAACRIFRGSRGDLLGCHLTTLLPDFSSFQRSAHSDADGADEQSCRLEGLACRLDQTTCPIELALRKVSVNRESWLVAILRDITILKAHESRLRHLALHDALTGLPNRLLLKDRLNQALRVARRSIETVTLAILDLDRFKEVNDTLGHQVGDALLIDVAERLVACVRDGDTVARLGGDEFALVLPQRAHSCSAQDVARRIVATFDEPFSLEGCPSLEVGLSVGLALYPDDADTESKLMQCADVAMYDAKRHATTIQRYDPDKDINSIRTLVLSGGLRQAIDNDQLSLVFQPKLNLPSQQIESFEVLTRWWHPDQGAIPPDEFVPQAEQSGNIIPFSQWTLKRTLDCLSKWRRDGLELNLALNLSPRSLHSKPFLSSVASLLDNTDVSPERITIELTETAVMLDPEGALACLRKLRDLGLKLSLDDFGTGYSSLSLLRRLPLNEIKIDRVFIDNMITNPEDKVIIASTISLAHNLGLDVVAEGVETDAQKAALTDLGCDVIQGYLIAEPLTTSDLVDWIEHPPWPVGKPDGVPGAEAPFITI